MATIKEITTMCKAGDLKQAYSIARADLEASSQNVWAQREVGWVLYYIIKESVETHHSEQLCMYLDELKALDLLTVEGDAMIFDSILWKLADYVKAIPNENLSELDQLFMHVCGYSFPPSKSYSYLLKQIIKFEAWRQMVDFLEWWGVDNLLPEDYQPFKMDNGMQIMSLAEQVYIAYSKSLLKQQDRGRIQAFIPKIEALIEKYPQMTYPGYFCGKLMIALGVEREEALDIVVPFVRKKKTDFWVWQLMADIYKDDCDVQLACLLRATHCRIQESFLSKVRTKLISLYLSRGDYQRAKYQLSILVEDATQHHRRLSYDVQGWLREGWVRSYDMDASDGVDYREYTDTILVRGTHESIGVVSYVDHAGKRAAIIYGEKLRAMVKFSELQVRVNEGVLLKLYWLPNNRGGINVVSVVPINDLETKLAHLRKIRGHVVKTPDKIFAFVKGGSCSCFIAPKEVQRYALRGGEKVEVLAVLDLNKKKNTWDWTCVRLTKLDSIIEERGIH